MTCNAVNDKLCQRLHRRQPDDVNAALTALIALQTKSSKFSAALDIPPRGFANRQHADDPPSDRTITPSSIGWIGTTWFWHGVSVAVAKIKGADRRHLPYPCCQVRTRVLPERPGVNSTRALDCGRNCVESTPL